MAGTRQRLPFFPASFYVVSRATLGTAALVAAQPLFNVDRRLIGAFIGVGRHSLGFEQGAGIQVQHTFGVKSEPILADGGMPGIAATEIFRQRLLDAIDDSLPQSHADIDVLA